MFERENCARAAIEGLLRLGASAAYARVSRAQLELQGRISVDPTNLYIANLPLMMDEAQVSLERPILSPRSSLDPS